MRTLLSQFCEDFDRVVRPMLTPLEGTTAALGASKSSDRVQQVLPNFRDLSHQLRALTEKVAEQQAYVLIFGPLKSGKSTLMNAISGEYVSEVTSLPAYPCMVYVSHSDELEFVLTKYNGEQETFTDSSAMRMQVNRAHKQLAKRIREVEDGGREHFDPAVHFPGALRRVDVKLVAGDLEESGAVLVDTPGLYTRMKFGYDRMTREFRDSAACAIFVVKSDNLFLEQVFEEFNQLLQLFSRIFLLVNLDTSKKDLRPDGSLAPSLEHDDPIRIIEAFETLAMSAPLKRAADDGRLRIYPVDLLRAASRRLRHEEASEGGPLVGGQADFDTFLGDFTDYLNSNEYLVAFLGDSLRHAGSLLSETGELCDHEAVEAIALRVAELESEEARAKLQAETLTRLNDCDWKVLTDGFQTQLLERNAPQVREIEMKTEQALRGALDGWFDSDESLTDLVERRLVPLHRSSQGELEKTLRHDLTISVQGQDAGLELTARMRNDLLAADIHLDMVARTAYESLRPENVLRADGPRLKGASVPVKRSLWDWLLFRSKARVNRRIFGLDSGSDKPIPSTLKAKRLGEPAREALWSDIKQHLAAASHKRLRKSARLILGAFATALRDDLGLQITTGTEATGVRLEEIAGRLREDADVLAQIKNLRALTRASLEALDDLSERYGETEPELLIQPVPPPESPPESGAPAETLESQAAEPAPSQETALETTPEATPETNA